MFRLQPVEQHLLGACQEAAKDCLDQPKQGKGGQQMLAGPKTDPVRSRANDVQAIQNTSGIK